MTADLATTADGRHAAKLERSATLQAAWARKADTDAAVAAHWAEIAEVRRQDALDFDAELDARRALGLWAEHAAVLTGAI